MGRRQPHTTAQDRRSAKEAVEAGWQGQSHQSVRPLEAYCRIGRVVEAAVEGWAAGQPSRPRHRARKYGFSVARRLRRIRLARGGGGPGAYSTPMILRDRKF